MYISIRVCLFTDASNKHKTIVASRLASAGAESNAWPGQIRLARRQGIRGLLREHCAPGFSRAAEWGHIFMLDRLQNKSTNGESVIRGVIQMAERFVGVAALHESR